MNPTKWCGDCKYAREHCNDPKSPCYSCKGKGNFIQDPNPPDWDHPFTGNKNIQNILDPSTLEYAAKWIENSLIGETNERVIEFGKNMAMSIRAAKTSIPEGLETQNDKR